MSTQLENKYEFDESVQKKIVALMVTDISFLGSIAIETVKPSYFDDVILQNITRWTISNYLEYKDTPTLAILYNEARKLSDKVNLSNEEIDRYHDTIRDLFAYDVQELDYIKDEVVSFAQQQSMRQAFVDAAEIFQKSPDKWQSIPTIFEKASVVGTGLDLGLNFSDLANITKNLGESFDTSKAVTTGLETVDNWFLWKGMYPGEIHLVCGRPGVGKSTVLSHIGVHALLNRKKVFYASFELSAMDILMKFGSRVTGLTMRELLDPVNSEIYQKKMTKIIQFQGEQNTLRVNFWPVKSASANTLRSYLVRLHAIEGFKPDIILIDYPALMCPNRGLGNDNYEDLGTIGNELIALGHEFGAPVVGAVQPQRHAWFIPIIEMEHLAESAKLAHIADSVLTLNMTRDEEQDGHIRIFGAKIRRGDSGRMMYCNFDRSRAFLEESSEKWSY